MKTYLPRLSLLAAILAIAASLILLTGCVTPATGNRALSDRGGGGNNAGFNNWENTQNLENPQYHTHNYYNAPGKYEIAGAPGGAEGSASYHATGGMHAINIHQDDSGDDIANPKTVDALGNNQVQATSPGGTQTRQPEAGGTQEEKTPATNPETPVTAGELTDALQENRALRKRLTELEAVAVPAPQPDPEPAPPVGDGDQPEE